MTRMKVFQVTLIVGLGISFNLLHILNDSYVRIVFYCVSLSVIWSNEKIKNLGSVISSILMILSVVYLKENPILGLLVFELGYLLTYNYKQLKKNVMILFPSMILCYLYYVSSVPILESTSYLLIIYVISRIAIFFNNNHVKKMELIAFFPFVLILESLYGGHKDTLVTVVFLLTMIAIKKLVFRGRSENRWSIYIGVLSLLSITNNSLNILFIYLISQYVYERLELKKYTGIYLLSMFLLNLYFVQNYIEGQGIEEVLITVLSIATIWKDVDIFDKQKVEINSYQKCLPPLTYMISLAVLCS